MARPAFQPTDDQRRQVVELRAARVSGIEIARRVGITKPTLWKYFGTELGAKPGRRKVVAAEAPAAKPKEENAAELPLFSVGAVSPGDTSPANAVRENIPPRTLQPDMPDIGPFRPSSRQRALVRYYASCRVPVEDIAIGMDLEVAVLKEHFAEELKKGPVKERLALLDNLKKAVDARQAWAIKLQLTMLFTSPISQDDEEPAVAPAVPASELGKKIQQINDARTAGQDTEWGDDLRPPGLVLVKG